MLLAEIVAARLNRTFKDTAPGTRLFVYQWRYLIAIPFAVVSVFMAYPMSGDTENYRVIGFPLFVAAFDEAGRCYVGPLTTPFFVGNLCLWYFFPQIVLVVWGFIGRCRRGNA